MQHSGKWTCDLTGDNSRNHDASDDSGTKDKQHPENCTVDIIIRCGQLLIEKLITGAGQMRTCLGKEAGCLIFCLG